MFLKSLSVSISMQVPRHSYGIQKTVLSVCSHLSACLRQSHVVCPCVFQASREPLSLPFRLPSECWDYGYMLLYSSLLGSMDPNPCPSNKLFLGFKHVYRFTGKKCLGFLKRINYSDIGGSYRRN